ncbi:MAG: CDP-6-deoxy-delta-3,4-glucoseen reductase, partial [Alcaligenes aquatilis]
RLIQTGSQREVALYWGGRRPKDLYQSELAEKWASELPNLRFIPVISDAQPEDGWTGRTGFVHQAVLADLPDLSAWQVYACGAPGMVEAARKDFVEQAQLNPDNYFADAFTSLADVK